MPAVNVELVQYLRGCISEAPQSFQMRNKFVSFTHIALFYDTVLTGPMTWSNLIDQGECKLRLMSKATDRMIICFYSIKTEIKKHRRGYIKQNLSATGNR